MWMERARRRAGHLAGTRRPRNRAMHIMEFHDGGTCEVASTLDGNLELRCGWPVLRASDRLATRAPAILIRRLAA
jgi:hypothetical protein